MSRFFVAALILLIALGLCSSLGQAQGSPARTRGQESPVLDASSFAAELHRLEGILHEKPSPMDLAALRDSLPRHWSVTVSGRTYIIPTEPLRNQLTALSSEKAQAWIAVLASEVERSSLPSRGTTAKAKSELDAILAEPEFGAVRPPSAWELARRRLAAWFQRLLLKLFSAVARYPISGQIIFWLVLTAGVLGVGCAVFRFFANRDSLQVLRSHESVVLTRTWQEWIQAAREAAKRDDFREAVHCAYWAGIVYLQDSGVLSADRTKTPREYLRLVSQPLPGELASSPAHREPLAGMTSRLERTWYANRGAGPEDFRESLRQLEELGCRLE